jgi:hypothetical protein
VQYNFVTELTSMVVIQNNITRAVEENAGTENDDVDGQQYARHLAYGQGHMLSASRSMPVYGYMMRECLEHIALLSKFC